MNSNYLKTLEALERKVRDGEEKQLDYYNPSGKRQDYEQEIRAIVDYLKNPEEEGVLLSLSDLIIALFWYYKSSNDTFFFPSRDKDFIEITIRGIHLFDKVDEKPTFQKIVNKTPIPIHIFQEMQQLVVTELENKLRDMYPSTPPSKKLKQGGGNGNIDMEEDMEDGGSLCLIL